MLPTQPAPRRPMAFHVYAGLCALTGLCGLALSLWAHPQGAGWQPPLHIATQIIPADYIGLETASAGSL